MPHYRVDLLHAHGSGSAGNPRRAVLFTALIALAIVSFGHLNLVASVVSMFFLISYGLLNYATYFEAKAKSPSFRPTFRFYHRRIGLIGSLACLGAMLAIDLAAGVAAVAVLFGIYQYLEYRAVPARWADSRRSHYLHQIRQHLLAAAAEAEHPRDWRPQLLVFSDSRQRRRRLLRFASWIEGGSGLTTVVRMLEGQGPEMLERRGSALQELVAEIKDGEFTAFPLIVTGEDLGQTISTVVQAAGIGPLRANTVVVNWIGGDSPMATSFGAQRFGRNLRTAFALGCNLLILDADADEWQTLDGVVPKDRKIDIWWRANKTGELMLLLGYLATRNAEWQDAGIRVLAEPDEGEAAEHVGNRLKATLEAYRIDAEVIVCRVDVQELMRQSGNSSLIFLPFSINGGRFYGPAGGEVAEYLKGLPIVILTMAARDVDLAADPDKETEEPAAERAEDDGQQNAIEDAEWAAPSGSSKER